MNFDIDYRRARFRELAKTLSRLARRQEKGLGISPYPNWTPSAPTTGHLHTYALPPSALDVLPSSLFWPTFRRRRIERPKLTLEDEDELGW